MPEAFPPRSTRDSRLPIFLFLAAPAGSNMKISEVLPGGKKSKTEESVPAGKAGYLNGLTGTFSPPPSYTICKDESLSPFFSICYRAASRKIATRALALDLQIEGIV